MASSTKETTGTGKTDAAYKLRNEAAGRVERLMQDMGPLGQMENSPRYRKALLGSEYRYPMSAVAETPMRKINNALELAGKNRKER